jgi:hypothetical protein
MQLHACKSIHGSCAKQPAGQACHGGSHNIHQEGLCPPIPHLQLAIATRTNWPSNLPDKRAALLQRGSELPLQSASSRTYNQSKKLSSAQ